MKVQNEDHIHIVNLVIETLENAKRYLDMDFDIEDLFLMGSQTTDKANPKDIDVYARIQNVRDDDGTDCDDLVDALWEVVHTELQPRYNGVEVDITLSEEDFSVSDEVQNPQPLILQS